MPQNPPIRIDWGLWAKRAVRLVGAAVAAAALAALLAQWRYGPLDTQTDILGYPAFTAFPVANYTTTYLAWGLLFPVVTALVYAAIGRLAPRVADPTHWLGQPLPPDVRGALPRSAAPLLGTLLVGATFGLAAAVVVAPRVGSTPGLTFLTSTLGLTVVVAASAWCATRVTRASASRVLPTMGSIAALVAPFTFLALGITARDSRVTLVETGAVEWIDWFPMWLAALLSMIGLVVVVLALRRASDDAAREKVVWIALTMTALPVAIVLLIARVPSPAAGPIDMFHEGEGLAASLMLRAGMFPWKDYIGVHGPLDDGLAELVGTTLVQDSRWGALAGDALLLVPLYWVSTFALLGYVLRRNRAVLLATVALVVATPGITGDLLVEPPVRFILVPLVVLAFVLLMRRPTAGPAALFVGLLVAQVVLTPESGYLIPASAVTLVAYELVHAGSARWRLASYPRTIRCAVAGAVALAAVGGFLASQGALGDFIDFFRTFSRDHPLTGGIPVQWEAADTPAFGFALFFVPALLAACFWYVVARRRARRPLELDDWAMGVLALFLVPYYMKALDRPDLPHVLQPWAVAIPLTVYVVARFLAGCDLLVRRSRVGARLARHGITGVITAVVLGAVLVTTASGLHTKVDRSERRFLPRTKTAVASGRVGYINPGYDPSALVEDLAAVLPTGDGRADVFDFTGSPALFYYLLDEQSPTRYFHVSAALRRESQEDLVGELRAAAPEYVVFDSLYTGLPAWDGISNPVRHYLVSQYLLDHYQPFVELHGFTILRRRGSAAPPPPDLSATRDANAHLGSPTTIRPCRWGRAPEFLNDRPRPTEAVTVGESSAKTRRLTVDLPDSPSDYQFLRISSPTGLRPGTLRLVQDGQAITSFVVGDDSPSSLAVRVGSCPQWHWNAHAGPASLTAEAPQDLRVELIRDERRPAPGT